MTMNNTELIRAAREAKQARQFAEALARLAPLLSMEYPPVGALLLASDCTQLLDPSASGARVAEGYLRRALELDPSSVEATLELGHLLFSSGIGTADELGSVVDRAGVVVAQAEVSLALLRAALLRDRDDYTGAYEVIAPVAGRHPHSTALQQELALLREVLGDSISPTAEAQRK